MLIWLLGFVEYFEIDNLESLVDRGLCRPIVSMALRPPNYPPRLSRTFTPVYSPYLRYIDDGGIEGR